MPDFDNEVGSGVEMSAPAEAEVAPSEDVQAASPAAAATTVQVDASVKHYPSLYDTLPTTVGAIIIGVGIIGGIQWVVRKIFMREKAEHKALTQFVTAMFALIVGVWIADKLIAGPSTNLLHPNESKELLTFIKDITLMVFSYYFGTKANVSEEPQYTEGGDDA